jgi:hypothetical protein
MIRVHCSLFSVEFLDDGRVLFDLSLELGELLLEVLEVLLQVGEASKVKLQQDASQKDISEYKVSESWLVEDGFLIGEEVFVLLEQFLGGVPMCVNDEVWHCESILREDVFAESVDLSSLSKVIEGGDVHVD